MYISGALFQNAISAIPKNEFVMQMTRLEIVFSKGSLRVCIYVCIYMYVYMCMCVYVYMSVYEELFPQIKSLKLSLAF